MKTEYRPPLSVIHRDAVEQFLALLSSGENMDRAFALTGLNQATLDVLLKEPGFKNVLQMALEAGDIKCRRTCQDAPGTS